MELYSQVTYKAKPTNSIGIRLKGEEAGATEFEGRSHNTTKRRNGGGRDKGAAAEGVGRNQRPLQVQEQVWEFQGSRPEPGPLRVQVRAWDLKGRIGI